MERVDHKVEVELDKIKLFKSNDENYKNKTTIKLDGEIF